MATPNLITTDSSKSNGRDTVIITTNPINSLPNDLIVIKCVTESITIPMGAPSCDGLVFTEQYNGPPSGSFCWEGIWTAPVPNANVYFISSGAVSAACSHAMTAELWRYAKIDPVPNSNLPRTGSGGTTLSNMTTVGTESRLTWVCGDKASINPQLLTYDKSTSASVNQELLVNGSVAGSGVFYLAHQFAVTPGVQNMGITNPTGMTWSMAAIEIKYSAPQVLFNVDFSGSGSVSFAATVNRVVTNVGFSGVGTFAGNVSVITPPTLTVAFSGNGIYASTVIIGTTAAVASFSGTGYLLLNYVNPARFSGDGSLSLNAYVSVPSGPQILAFVQIGKQTGYGTVRSPNNLKYPARVLNGDYASIDAIKARLKAVNSGYYTNTRLNHMTLNDLIHSLIELDTVK